jgi:cytochrome c553
LTAPPAARDRGLLRGGVRALRHPRAWFFAWHGVAVVLLSATGAASAAPFEDTMAQRVLACTGCHGAQGRAAPDGYYPRIAGKPAGYLFNQLLNFRDGRRHYELMAGLLAPLDDAYLRQMAEHFASLDLPYPPPGPPAGTPAARSIGERLVKNGDSARGLAACNDCHGAAMTGRPPFIPGLLGLPRDYLNAQLGAWQNGKRRAHEPDCMAHVAARLVPGDIAAISSYLASLPVPATMKAGGAPEPVPEVKPLPLPCGGIEGSGAGSNAKPGR